ncbi:hypothetical protein D8S78_23820 [Natrialba swarupiae]|nr:hypothetical protein [Natrialba swarupiae]
MLAFERDLPRALEQKNRREFRPWVGGELHGKTLGVVGLGSIGTRVAELGDAFGMEILGTKRDPSTAPSVVETVYGPSSTEQLCAQSDYVVLTCPLTERTRGSLTSENSDRWPAIRYSSTLPEAALSTKKH